MKPFHSHKSICSARIPFPGSPSPVAFSPMPCEVCCNSCAVSQPHRQMPTYKMNGSSAYSEICRKESMMEYPKARCLHAATPTDCLPSCPRPEPCCPAPCRVMPGQKLPPMDQWVEQLLRQCKNPCINIFCCAKDNACGCDCCDDGDGVGCTDNSCSVATGLVLVETDTRAIINNNVYACCAATVSEVGVEYATDSQFSDVQTATTSITSPFTVELPTLVPDTTYYVRAYIESSCGRFIGQVVSFNMPPEITPMVFTGTVGIITDTTATIDDSSYFDITDPLLAGIEYATDPFFTDSNSVTTTPTDTFSVDLDGLSPGTTYYYRAFVDSGIGRTLGDILSFETSSAETSTTIARQRQPRIALRLVPVPQRVLCLKK